MKGHLKIWQNKIITGLQVPERVYPVVDKVIEMIKKVALNME